MLKNPLLQQAVEGIEGGVKDKEVHAKVVGAGLKVMYAQSTFDKLAEALNPDGDLVAQAGNAVMLVLNGLAEKARGSLKATDMISGGMVLMLNALQTLEDAELLKIEPSTLDQATTVFLNELLPKFGLTPDRMDELLGSVQETINNPERMAQYQASIGGE